MFPINKPTIEEAKADFKKLLEFDSRIIKRGEWSTRYEYLYPKIDRYIDISNVGLQSSNHFHFEARMCCDSINSPSPIRSWFNPKFKEGLYKCKIANGNMRTAIAMRKYIASQFRPTAAKALYNAFKAVHIFDPCMGWGDRLSGFLASNAESYTGLDVNPHLFLGYQRQLGEFNIGQKTVDIYLERAEKFSTDRKFDFIFTSPPYFDVERYEGMWQSHNSYKTLDSWLKNFLFKMLNTCMDSLEVGGHIAINISDVYAHHTINKICDPMVKHVLKNKQMKYKGCIGYRMAKRPNSKAVGDIFCEPIWIFKKFC